MIRIIETNQYTNCIEITNKEVRVVIEPNYGGRVLYYERSGKNVLFVDPREDGYTSASKEEAPLKNLSPCAGRFDIGPEMTIAAHPTLWYGKYTSEILNDFSVKILSEKDDVTGVQLERIFELDDASSRLSCTQTIHNVSDEEKQYFFWSRTFAQGGGVCVVPLNPISRYPKGYLMYGPGDTIDYMPEKENNVHVDNAILKIVGPPERAKFAMDSMDGWLAYFAKNNLLFVKKFPCFPNAVYGEIAANTISIWYNGEQMTELEPIGPLENIAPGAEASFTEEWFLIDYPFSSAKTINNETLVEIVEML